MTKIYMKCYFTVYTVCVSEQIAKNIVKHRRSFDKWLYDKNNNHGYWVEVNGVKKGVSYGIDAFVKYLNDFCLLEDEEKAYIYEYNTQNVSEDCITLFF